jgi:hypothetical protein
VLAVAVVTEAIHQLAQHLQLAMNVTDNGEGSVEELGDERRR